MALTRITKGVIKPNENYDTHNINSTGIVTAVGANFSGNVSVGGVLTYEDVTNIDSVGIVTARQGILIDDSISHIGDTNTKIRFPNVGKFTVETAGVERFRIADDGRIGINDNTPNDYELDILKRPAATDAQIRLYNNGTTSTSDTIMRYQIGGTTANNYIYFGDSADVNAGQIRYSHSNNFLSVHTNAAERIRIDSDGFVGIGTNNPDHNLHVFSGSGDAVITIESTGNGNHSALEFFRTSSGGDSKGAGSIYVTGDTSASEARMHFGVGHNIAHGQLPRMTIMGNGEVGIGTDNPGSILDVRQENDGGQTKIMLYNTDNDNTTTQTAGLFMSPDSRAYAYAGLSVKKEVADMSSNAGRDVSLVLNVTENNAQVEAVHIASSGSVGIGTNSPYNTGLDVRFPLTTVATFSSLANGTQGADVSIIHTKSGITDNDKVGQISFSGGALGNATTYAQIRTIATDISDKKGDIAFYMRNGNNTTGSLIDDERLRITSGGNVGIGTNNPSYRLDVRAEAFTKAVFKGTGANANNIGLFINSGDSASQIANTSGSTGESIILNASNNAILFETNDTEALRITSGGNVGIGTINPVRPLHILSADCRIRLEDAGIATDVELQNTSGDAVLTTNGASNVRLQTNNTERLRVNSDGRVLVGTTAARTVGGAVTRLLQVEGTDGSSGISITRNSNNASTPTLDFGKSRGNSVGSNVIVQEDDQLGVIQFCGSDGTDIETEAAQIVGQVDGTPGSNDMPGRLVFKTTPDGSSTAVERLRISANGKILIGSGTIRNIGGASALGHFQIEGTTGNTSSVSLINNQNNANGVAVLRFAKTRATSDGGVTTVVDGDSLGSITFTGADGTDLLNSTAQIRAIVNGTVAGNTIPTDIIFETSATDGSSASEKLRITSDGKVGINVTDPDAALETVSTATNGKNAYLGGQYNDGGQSAVRRIEFGTTNYRNYIQGQQGSGGSSFSNSDLLLNPNGGDVGISVTDPDAKLEVRDSAATGFIVRCTNTQSTNSNKALRVRNNSDTNTFHVSHKGQGYFADSIGISTSEPVSKLEVRGDINFQNNALISNFDSNGVGGSNIDHIWHSDAPFYGTGGTWNFVSDTTYKATGNSAIQIGYLANSGGGHLIGDVGIGLTTISRGPLHVHENSSDDCEIHLTNNDTGTTSSDGLTIFTDTDTSGVWSREDVPFDIATAGTRSIRLHNTGGLSINTTSKSTSALLHVDNHGERNTGSDVSNASQYVIVNDCHFGGTGGSLSANRSKAGIRNDIEFTSTTPSTTVSGNRFSVFGIHNDLHATKYAYVTDGIYSFVKSTADNQPSSSGTTTIRGVYGYAQGYLTSSSQNVNIYGGYFLGYRGGSVTNGHAYGIYTRAHNTNGTNNTGDLTGVYSEWEQDDSTTIANAYCFRGYGDRDGGTITNGYILYGSFGGDGGITNRWGIYINDSAKNRLGGDLEVTGALSKGSGSFRIPHPLVGLSTTKDLVHSFIEGPQCDLIYRGKVDLVGGTATINIDTKTGMTEGTFVALNRDIQCFTSNETGWTAVKGSVTGNKLTIIAQDNTCTDTISWMVVGERQDDNIKESTLTDDDGNLILEIDKRTDLNDKYQAECEKNVYNQD